MEGQCGLLSHHAAVQLLMIYVENCRGDYDPKYLSNHNTRLYTGRRLSQKFWRGAGVMEDVGRASLEHTSSTSVSL